jgi:CheY-like chemotaxis protein
MSEKPKILVVDDDRDLVEVLRLTLETAGFVVAVAYDAAQGLAQTESQRPDLILLDVMMPNATEGFHFVWKLRQYDDERLRTTPIVMLTAVHEKTSLRFYPDTGDGTYQPGEYLPVQEFIDKPVDPVWLVEKLKQVLGRQRGR